MRNGREARGGPQLGSRGKGKTRRHDSYHDARHAIDIDGAAAAPRTDTAPIVSAYSTTDATMPARENTGRNDRNVRFHAFQGLYLFVALLLVEWVLTPMFRVIHEPMFRVDKLLQALILFVCVFMIVKASQEETYSLPIIGELAARSAAEH